MGEISVASRPLCNTLSGAPSSGTERSGEAPVPLSIRDRRESPTHICVTYHVRILFKLFLSYENFPMKRSFSWYVVRLEQSTERRPEKYLNWSWDKLWFITWTGSRPCRHAQMIRCSDFTKKRLNFPSCVYSECSIMCLLKLINGNSEWRLLIL